MVIENQGDDDKALSQEDLREYFQLSEDNLSKETMAELYDYVYDRSSGKMKMKPIVACQLDGCTVEAGNKEWTEICGYEYTTQKLSNF